MASVVLLVMFCFNYYLNPVWLKCYSNGGLYRLNSKTMFPESDENKVDVSLCVLV